MIGVTIGIGPGWQACAERAATQMAAMTGLSCHVVTRPHHTTEVAHPSWLKCWITEMFPAEDAFLLFDADILPLRPWDPDGIFHKLGRPFLAVPEDNTPPVFNECRRYQLPPWDWYVNGGLTIFGHEHAPIWRAVWKRHPGYGSWLEQTALNHVLLESGTPVCRLPRQFNQLLHGRLDLAVPMANSGQYINLHADSLGGDASRLATLQDTLFGLAVAPSRPLAVSLL